VAEELAAHLAGRDDPEAGELHLGPYGHLYPEADTALRDRLDVLYGTSRPTPWALSSGYAGRAAVAPVWPQAATGTTRAPPMMVRRRSNLRLLGVEVRGFEPLASSVRDLC
jgi:hypothetical protein